ncbi:MAG TPA: histidine phosphatase family protein [Rhizomicrobium sp.]
MTQLLLREGLTLYFCRHGETEANVKKLFQGRTADSPLTDLGREQARIMAAILKRECPDPASLAYVCSPFPRAVTTMKIIRGALDLPQDGFTTDPRIQEINLGSWDGLTDAQAKGLDPAMFEKRGADKWNVRVPGGGENYADVAKRAEDWVGDLKTDTFAVSHGAFTRILRGLFLGLEWKAMSDLDEQQGVVFRVRGSTLERLEAK